MNLKRLVALGALATLAGCASQTLFRSNFDTSDVGGAPTGAQSRGTLASTGGAQVINPPDGSSGNWLQVRGIEGRLITQPAPGIFRFASVVDLPAASGTGTIAFNAHPLAGATQSFLTLQFLPNNRVRIDNNPATEFGAFARNTPFQVLVTLDTAAAHPTAHIRLTGAGASGATDVTLADPSLAQRFDTVAFLSAGDAATAFAATNIAVTRPTQLREPDERPETVTMRD